MSGGSMNYKDIEIGSRKAAREILSKIEEVYFSEEYAPFRIDYGSNGARDLIVQWIQNRYHVQ